MQLRNAKTAEFPPKKMSISSFQAVPGTWPASKFSGGQAALSRATLGNIYILGERIVFLSTLPTRKNCELKLYRMIEIYQLLIIYYIFLLIYYIFLANQPAVIWFSYLEEKIQGREKQILKFAIYISRAYKVFS